MFYIPFEVKRHVEFRDLSGDRVGETCKEVIYESFGL